VDEVRLGLVGCGRLAERGYVPAAERARGLRLTAVADSEPARCARAAPGVPAFARAEELVEAGGVDALVIATDVDSHLTLARLAAAAGLRSLVEKPPGRDGREAAQLAQLDPPPAIGFNRRFEPALERLRESLPASGRIELSLSIRYRRSSWAPYAVGDDALLDLGPHLVDLASRLGGEVTRARALGLSERRFEVDLGLERGRARIAGSTDRPYREVFEATVDGRRAGRCVYGGLVAGLATRLRPRQAHPLVRSLRAQLEAFADVVRGGSSDRLARADDGVAAMLVVDAARASAGAGGRSWRAVVPEAV
jgi:predicted dehydrogenase